MSKSSLESFARHDMRTIDESIKGAASQNRYGITFDGNIDVMYNNVFFIYWLDPYLKMEEKLQLVMCNIFCEMRL